ncbi:hypothetical protein DUNSADRAFT_15171 [Dunaliella salina]|uniref:Ubiquitin-like protease family profile domain-containing protein n=1 Tax=Dunaliella salina TaxID=3046 RepID=A0ABQ7G5W7_DUNSA|nr:hypothetical protein DUNSADRAFT_15171 [Dunaliella salina]|eukprot:KAF5830014.1 hypothetical protein DUNSADRAFT_15171 [Dunaliella salina]
MKRRAVKTGRRRRVHASRSSSWPKSAAVQVADRQLSEPQAGSRRASSSGVSEQHVATASDPMPSSSDYEADGGQEFAPEAAQQIGDRDHRVDEAPVRVEDKAAVRVDDVAGNSHGQGVAASQEVKEVESEEGLQMQQHQQEQEQWDALARRCPADMDMDPALLAKWSLHVGLLQGKADSCGTHSGNWVADSAIFQVLEPLTFPEAQHFTFNCEAFELNVCYLEAGHVQIPDTRSKLPKANLMLLVTHIMSETEGLHFSAMILNVKCKVLHVFDTLGRQADSMAASVFNQQYPRLKIFQKGFSIQNHTGRLRQSMATCGVWATWLCFAYAVNYRQCRDPITDRVDTAKLQGDVVSFWKGLTF